MLKDVIERYGNLKAEMDGLKKQVDQDNKEIKKVIVVDGKKVEEDGKVKYVASSDNYTATLSYSYSENFDEQLLVEKLKELWSENGSMQNPYLKLVYVPDMNAIENAIYNGKLNAADLSSCRVRNETSRLTIKKEKKDED